jgi:ribosomal protein L21E
MFEKGDSVRIDIPNKDDPDHDRWHGTVGTVVNVREDDAGVETGDERDNVEYRVESDDNGASMWFRWRDLRPTPTGER